MWILGKYKENVRGTILHSEDESSQTIKRVIAEFQTPELRKCACQSFFLAQFSLALLIHIKKHRPEAGLPALSLPPKSKTSNAQSSIS